MTRRSAGAVLALAILGADVRAETPAEFDEFRDLPWTPSEGRELIGTPAPDLDGLEWISGEPLSLERLRGKPFLLRFWTVDCPLCRETAPALREIHEAYASRGLVVIGIHHPKTASGRRIPLVLAAASGYGFSFPLAQDARWKTLEAYWLGGGADRRFTSVSFLVDGEGTIRFLHDGGEFHEGGGDAHETCQRAYRALRTMIERVLEESEK